MSDAPAFTTLPEPRTDVLEALQQVAPGRVHSRPSDRLAYAHDASHYRLPPAAVVVPRTAAEVAALLQRCTALGAPVTFRSAGTSLSGQASSSGIVLDTRRSFRSIRISEDGSSVTCGPGATIRAVNSRLAPTRRKLGPDPASEAACTIGGVVANNSSGMACGTDANTYRTLESCVLVLPSGTTIDTAAPDADAQLRRSEPSLHAGLVELRDLVRASESATTRISELFSIKNTMGYAVNAFVDFDRPVDILQHLVVGSEGTLAFVASATLRTVPVNPFVSTGILVFPSLEAATRSLPVLVDAGFATIELLDSTSLKVAQSDPDASSELRSISVDTHAAFLVEFQDPDQASLDAHLASVEALFDELPLSQSATLTTDPGIRAGLWRIRKGLYALVAGNRPPGTTALLEDVAVPVGNMLALCNGLTSLFDRHGYEASVIFGHAKDGNIHFMLNESFDDPEHVARYEAFTEDLVELVLSQHGTLKAEHGTGRIMAPFVRRQYGQELYDVMVAVKRLLDPAGILNPGVLLVEDPNVHIQNLKPVVRVEDEVDRCVECGYCEPICPSRDLTTTPRQRIVLRREIAIAEDAGDRTLADALREEYQYDAIDTCAVDGMCQTACPVDINTGDLVRRLRSEQSSSFEQAAWRTAARQWAAAARAGSAALSLADALPAAVPTHTTAAARGLLGAGAVPLYTADLPSGGTVRTAIAEADPEIVYFSSCVNTMFGPAPGGDGVSAAFLRLCERARVRIRTPDRIAGLCCGTPWKSKGMSKGLSVMREQVRDALLEATEGVGSPSCPTQRRAPRVSSRCSKTSPHSRSSTPSSSSNVACCRDCRPDASCSPSSSTRRAPRTAWGSIGPSNRSPVRSPRASSRPTTGGAAPSPVIGECCIRN
ncbi:ferredoxin [Agromyces marinus]|uniref:D-lactate dehydrogenase (cytochrome) n=1 Tax=Agromyces marinus TaxID=1389020 RepID=A0ABN6YEI4_9MICO|nr:ferredoxin [Agromyces marinus]